jgi:hypothetical protein
LSAPQNQTLLDLPKIIAVGIASPAATLLTSRFGVAGTLLGLALSAVFVTVVVDVLKVYLARVPGAVTTIPGGLRKKSSLRNVFERMKRPFSKVGSLSRAQRRSFLIGSLGAAGISCVVGLILITGVELSVGKSLSCWVWDECSAEEESSAADGSGRTAQASTLPSILGGGQNASSSTTPPGEVVNPQNPQQQPRGGGSSSSSSSSSSSGAPQEAPWQASPEEVPGSDTPQPSSSAQPGQRQGPSGSAGGDQQQEVPSSRSNPADQQQPSSADDSQGSGGQ